MTKGHRKRKDLEHVGDLLDQVVSAIGERAGRGGSAVLWSEWHDIAGSEWADASPLRLERGVLSVAVPDGMTATRLRYATGSLVDRISARIGPDHVSSIRIQIRRSGGYRR